MADDKRTKEELVKEVTRLEDELRHAKAKLNIYAEKHRKDNKTIAEYLSDRNK